MMEGGGGRSIGGFRNPPRTVGSQKEHSTSWDGVLGASLSRWVWALVPGAGVMVSVQEPINQ